MFKTKTLLSVGLASSFLVSSASAQSSTTLSELAVFHRCYSQITSMRAKASDTLTQQVSAGTLKAVDACMQVFQSAQLSTGTSMSLSNPSDARAVSILATFHRLHASWFANRDFTAISGAGYAGDIKDLYDSTSPALYITRALLGPNIQAKDAVTTTDFLTPIRTNMAPTTGPESAHPISDYYFTTAFSFAPTGTMTGIRKISDVTMSFPAAATRQGGTQVNLYTNWGGGYLGTTPYILENLAPEPSGFATDGATQMHRRYGKAVYLDALCRDLPVVRLTDASSFVDATSSVPFRTSSSCTQCHASHDRLSSVIRGAFVYFVGGFDPTVTGSPTRGGSFPVFKSVTQPALGAPQSAAGWPTSADNNYSSRPQDGVLFYRDYNGNLVDQAVSGVGDLGQKIAATDDFYICMAKRYYRYFVGVDVNTGDLNDPTHLVSLNTIDTAHRQNVVSLGLALKQNQSLPTLIRSILSLDVYKKSDFGVHQ